jgi:hypothetical protein
MQPIFSKSFIFSSLALAVPILGLHAWSQAQANREAGADARVSGDAHETATSAGLRSWRLTALDQRFGGLSGLAVDGSDLVALSDSGVVVRFAPPVRGVQRVAFSIHDLPDGPGPATSKRGRDSEALLADSGKRGWWVSFEGAHSLWRFDRDFTRAEANIRLHTRWYSNKGGEALSYGEDGAVLVLPELGGAAVAVGGRSALEVPRGTSDATRLADGRRVLLVRRLTLGGFQTEVRIAAGAGKAPRRIVVPLAPLDNAEAIAAARLPNGGTRLWIVTDDNFRPWMRTLLVALDLRPSA